MNEDIYEKWNIVYGIYLYISLRLNENKQFACSNPSHVLLFRYVRMHASESVIYVDQVPIAYNTSYICLQYIQSKMISQDAFCYLGMINNPLPFCFYGFQ